MEIVYLPHGGGPLPLLNEPSHAGLSQFLTALPQQLELPEAILVISAHWEEKQPTLTSGLQPDLIYDYYGFPEAAYRLTYPAPGAPELAAEVADLLQAAGQQPRLDDQRGFDHGVFVPLLLMYPEAQIPCLQLSLLSSLDPEAHLALGQALRPLRDKNILVIGSGLSFHNLALIGRPQPETIQASQHFDAWLNQTLTDTRLSSTERYARLSAWEQAPASRMCHPREEHLLPLHVCAGLSERPAQAIFNQPLFEYAVSGFAWSAASAD